MGKPNLLDLRKLQHGPINVEGLLMHPLGEAIEALFKGLLIVCAVFVPLGLWKLFELAAWVARNIHWGAP